MSFNANDYDTSDNIGSVAPAGEYTLALVKAERKESSTAGNYYLNCQFNGKYDGKPLVVWHMFNLKNSNTTAQEIAERDLAKFMKAVGVKVLKDKWDISQLLNKPFTARLTIQKDEQYGDKNKIAGWKALEGSSDSFKEKKKGKKNKKNKNKKNKKKGKKKKGSGVPF